MILAQIKWLMEWRGPGVIIAEVVVVPAIFGLVCWVIGLAARRALQLPMQLGPDVAVKHVIPKWTTGTIGLGLLVLLSDLVFHWRGVTHQFGMNLAEDIGYLLGTVITAAIVGLITGLISRRGLSQAQRINKEIHVGAFE